MKKIQTITVTLKNRPVEVDFMDEGRQLFPSIVRAMARNSYDEMIDVTESLSLRESNAIMAAVLEELRP